MTKIPEYVVSLIRSDFYVNMALFCYITCTPVIVLSYYLSICHCLITLLVTCKLTWNCHIKYTWQCRITLHYTLYCLITLHVVLLYCITCIFDIVLLHSMFMWHYVYYYISWTYGIAFLHYMCRCLITWYVHVSLSYYIIYSCDIV